MVFSIIKWTIISLTLIFLIHHLYMFLLNTLTVPKIKDLVNKPNEQYRDIFATLNNNKNNNAKAQIIPTEQNMTEELSLFLNDLKIKGSTKGSALSNPKGAALSNPYDGENYNDIPSSVVGEQDHQDIPSSVVGGRNPHYSPF